MPLWNDLFDNLDEYLIEEKLKNDQHVSDDEKRKLIKLKMKTASPEMVLKYKQLLGTLISEQRAAQQIGYQISQRKLKEQKDMSLGKLPKPPSPYKKSYEEELIHDIDHFLGKTEREMRETEYALRRQIDMKMKMLHIMQQKQSRPPIPPGLSSGVQSIVNMPSGNFYDTYKKASESKTNNQYVNHIDYEEDYVFEPYTDRPYIAWCRVCELVIDKKEKCCPTCSDPNSILVYRQKKGNIELKKEQKLKAEAEALELKMKSLPKCGDPNCIGGCSVVDCFPVDDNKKKVTYLDLDKKQDKDAFLSLLDDRTKNQLSAQDKKDLEEFAKSKIFHTAIFLIMIGIGAGIYAYASTLFGSFWLVGSAVNYTNKIFKFRGE